LKHLFIAKIPNQLFLFKNFYHFDDIIIHKGTHHFIEIKSQETISESIIKEIQQQDDVTYISVYILYCLSKLAKL
jgi:hypothetical protein